MVSLVLKLLTYATHGMSNRKNWHVTRTTIIEKGLLKSALFLA